MHALLFAPIVVAVIGAAALLPALARVAREASGWRHDAERLSDLRPALVELRTATTDMQRTARALRDR